MRFADLSQARKFRRGPGGKKFLIDQQDHERTFDRLRGKRSSGADTGGTQTTIDASRRNAAVQSDGRAGSDCGTTGEAQVSIFAVSTYDTIMCSSKKANWRKRSVFWKLRDTQFRGLRPKKNTNQIEESAEC